MNCLYLIERTDEDTYYDEYWGFVISAPTEPLARNIASDNKGDEGVAIWQKKTTRVRRIDINGTDEPTGVVLSDFHAG